MSETLTDSELAEWYDTAMSTAAALAWSPATPPETLINGMSPHHRESFEVTIDTKAWTFRVIATRTTVLITRKPSQTTLPEHELVDEAVSELTRRRLGELICEVVWGERYIPVENRRAFRRIISNAARDADFYLRTARARWNGVIPAPVLNDDDAEAWDHILAAAQDEVGHPLGYMWSYRMAQVPMFAFDVYDDAFIEAASHKLIELRKEMH